MATFAGLLGLMALPLVDTAGNTQTTAVVTLFASDGVTSASTFSNRTKTVLANPMPTGVAVGSAGVDTQGRLLVWADPGRYVLSVVVGVAAPVLTQVTVVADPDDRAELDAVAPIRVGVAAGSSPNGRTAAQNTLDFDLIRRMGGDSIRNDLDWSVVQAVNAATFDWAIPDMLVDIADAAGLRTLFIITGSPAWARTASEASKAWPPTDVSTYATFCIAAVSRYKSRGSFGVHEWEIWNEPNSSTHFGNPTAYAKYVALIGAAYPAIKAADPTAIVVTGGLNRGGLENWTTANLDTHWLTQAYAAGLQGKFDAFGYHPYAHGYDPLATTPTGEPTGAEFVTNGTFDVDATGWTGTNASLARVTTPVRTGAGALSMTVTAAGSPARAGSSSSFVGITAGQRYIAQAWIRSAAAGEAMVVQFDWRDAASVYLSSNIGYSVVDNSSGWSLITVRANAPTSATRVSVVVLTSGNAATAGLVHYVDDISLKLTSDEAHGWNRLALLRAIMVANGDAAKPIWVTEVGQHTGTAPSAATEAQQAAWLGGALSRVREFPYVDRFWWHSNRDKGTDAANIEDNYGVVRNDGVTLKPAFEVLRDRIAYSSSIPVAASGTAPTSGAGTSLSRTGHAHPRTDWQAADNGLISWAYDSAMAGSSTAAATAGTLYVTKMHVPVAATVTNLITIVSTGGVSLTSGQCFASLYQGGVLLGTTSDQSTLWASGGPKIMAIAGGSVAVAAGDVYVALWFNGTTGPAFARQSALSSVNINLAGASSRFGTADTGRTTSAPATLGTVAAISMSYWVGLS